MKKEDKEIKTISKGKIAIAWILLIVLICSLGGITYIKFFSNITVDNNNTEDSNSVQQLSEEEKEILEKIVENFNKNKKISEYEQQKIIIKAAFENNAINIYYNSRANKNYSFTLENGFLVNSNDSNDKEIQKVISLIIYANQERLGNNENIDKILDAFFNNDEEIDGLVVESTEANVITYKININQIIGTKTSNNEKNESKEQTETNKNTTTNENTNYREEGVR